MKIEIPDFSNGENVNEFYAIGGTRRIIVSSYLNDQLEKSELLKNVMTGYSREVIKFISEWYDKGNHFILIIKTINENIVDNEWRHNKRYRSKFIFNNEYLVRYGMATAIRLGYLDVVKSLLSDDEFFEDYYTKFSTQTGISLIRSSVDHGQVDILKYLLSWRGPNNERMNTCSRDKKRKIDPAKNKDKILELLLSWRGPNGISQRRRHTKKSSNC